MICMKKIIILLTLLITYSCSKEEFLPPINSSSSSASSTSSSSTSSCAKFTYVRPPVDLLFIWDNSTSSIYLNSATKTALTNLINSISERYDYNVMLAPLIGSGNNEAYFFSRAGTTPGNGITTIQKSQAASILDSFTRASGSFESGTQRAVDLIKNNISNGAFRSNAYTLVITMSNEDDDGYQESGCSYCFNPDRQQKFIKAKAHDLLCMRGNYSPSSYYQSGMSTFNSSCSDAPKLNSLMMRYLTVTANQEAANCSVSKKLTKAVVYPGVSKNIYNEPYTNGFDFLRPGYLADQFDICTGDYVNIFSGVNDAISDAILAHQYRYWPLSDSNTEVDIESISVTKSNGNVYYPIDDSVTITRDLDGTDDKDSSGNKISGFRYVGNGTFNTRFLPTAGESYTGQAIELFGDAKVQYPECLLISSSTVTQYFGYAAISDKPNESTIKVTKNGVNIPQSSSNGWELVKSNGVAVKYTNYNIRITSATDTTPMTPAVYKTGYLIKLNGTSIYKSGDTIKVNYSSSGN